MRPQAVYRRSHDGSVTSPGQIPVWVTSGSTDVTEDTEIGVLGADSVDAAMTDSELPKGMGAPAPRALTSAEYTTLEQLHGVPAADLTKLHGVGPKAVGVLQEALEQHGYALG